MSVNHYPFEIPLHMQPTKLVSWDFDNSLILPCELFNLVKYWCLYVQDNWLRKQNQISKVVKDIDLFVLLVE